MLSKAESFKPESDTTQSYRKALGRFATGVTVVTCRDAQGPLSIAANSFTSVSLDPPLILWAPAKGSRRHDSFAAAQTFCVHVLREDQLELCVQASSGGRNFALGQWMEDSGGVPLLPTALARFDCRHHAAHDAGDHTIIIGYVERVTCQDGDPLLFTQGNYGGFTSAF